MLFVYSCGNDITQSNSANEKNNNNSVTGESELLEDEETDYPSIVRVNSFDEIPEDKKEQLPKIVKMSDDYYSGNEIERLNICKDSSYEGFLFDYMGYLLNGYVGKTFLHLEINEPFAVSGIHNMDALLPFTPQMTGYKNQHLRENFLWDFSSYVSVSDSLNPYSLGFNYMESFKSINSKMEETDVILYKNENNTANCLSPKWNEFETYSERTFGFGILHNPDENEVAPKFTTAYSFDPNREDNYFCELTNHTPSFTGCFDNGSCSGVYDAWEHNSYKGCDPLSVFCYWDMEYEIYPRKLTSNINGIDNSETCYFYVDDFNYHEWYRLKSETCKARQFNLIVKENRLPTSDNPNSKNVYFPMKTFYERDEGSSISLIYLPKGIDFTVIPNLIDIIQSAKVESLTEKIASLDFGELIDICEKEEHYKCPSKSIFNLFYSLSKKWYETVKDFNENDLLSFFQYFSNNPTEYPLNNKFETMTEYKVCISQLWNVYNKGPLKFTDSEYSWNYGLMKEIYNKTLYQSCQGYKDCALGQFCKSSEMTHVRACVKDEENCTCDVRACEDVQDCLCREDGICAGDQEGFGLECHSDAKATNHCGLESKYKVEQRLNNIPVKYAQTIKKDEVDYYIDITPEKLGFNYNIYYFGGGFDSIKKLIAYNYYRNLRYSGCESGENCYAGFIESCNSDSDCNPLNGTVSKYYCNEDNQCSTTLAAASFDIKTITANPLKIWLKWECDEILGVEVCPEGELTDTEDWGKSPTKVDVSINTMIYVLPRQNNKELFIDFIPGNPDNFNFVIDANGEYDAISEETIYDKVKEKTKTKLVDILTKSPIIPIDTTFSIFKTLDETFAEIKGDIKEKIDILLPEKTLPKFDDIDSLLKDLGL